MADPPKSKNRPANRANVTPYRSLAAPKSGEEENFIDDKATLQHSVHVSQLEALAPGADDNITALLAPPRGLRKEERRQFNKVVSVISLTMKPEGFLERYQCREIAGHIWRLEQLRDIRETFIKDHMDLALALMLIDQTSDDVVGLVTRMREGHISAQKQIAEFRNQFGITDADIRAQVELRYHGDLGRIDQHIRSVELVRDRSIDDFEKRRFMRLANKRLASQTPRLVERS